VDPRTPDFPAPVEPRPAAAVIGMRDGDGGLEVLLGQRSTAARFMGGFWVFPGGQVDPDDGEGEDGFRRAAARELAEEVSVTIPASALVPFDRWITPRALPRRFDTCFFAAAIGPTAQVRVDGHEIVASRWETPHQLLADAHGGTAMLAYPTLRQLERLRTWTSVAEALESCAATADAHGVPAVLVPDDAPFRR
jgi:8-oxo-dGTP pyrophosphatase MutT (NUDIX family)